MLQTLRLQGRAALAYVAAGERVRAGRGQSEAFAEHRPYVAGDELRHVDWRASARRGKLQTKAYAHQARLALELVVDASASMAYRGLAEGAAQTRATFTGEAALGPSAKWQACLSLAYATGCLALQRRDAAGLVAWRAAHARLLPARHGGAQGRQLLVHLAQLRAEGAGPACTARPPATLVRLLGPGPKRRRVVVLSDFLDPIDVVAPPLRALLARGHQVTAVHVRHPDECALPADFAGSLVALEGHALGAVRDGRDRATYAANARAHAARLAEGLGALGVQLVPHLVGAPLGPTLQALAAGRAL